jgi:hypothetical protein
VGFALGMMGFVALVRLETLIKTVKRKVFSKRLTNKSSPCLVSIWF